MRKLQDLDSLSVTVIVDNESDTMSTGIDSVHGFRYVSEKQRRASPDHTSPKAVPRPLCSAGHGLSLLLEAQVGDTTQILLMDAGPNPDMWQSNVESLGIDPAKIETAVLSHYHWDHSGGLRGAVPAVVQARKTEKAHDPKPLLVDLQSDAVISRGRPLPNNGVAPHHPDNPSAQELTELGARVELHDKEHTVGQNMFYVSGYIPRANDFETGIPGHLTLRNGKWVLDTEIPDERYVACHIKNRGLVVFSACSHAGINNVCRDALKKGGSHRHLFAVIGGFHLAGGQVEDRIPRTIKDLKQLHPSVVLAGHCTGWRAKAQLALEFEGRFQPLAVGATYKFTSNS